MKTTTKKQYKKPCKKKTVRNKGKWQGMNWITQVKRLAIYLRDGLACCYCGACVEDGAILTLDHVRPHSKGGTNHESNLITSCKTCNSSRGNRSVDKFVYAVVCYRNHGLLFGDVMQHIETSVEIGLDEFIVEAKRMIARRGSAAKAIARIASPGYRIEKKTGLEKIKHRGFVGKFQ